MESLSVHHVSLMVSDLDEALHFYTELLGLKPLPRPDGPIKGAWLSAGNAQVHLIVGDVDSAPLTEQRRRAEGRGLAQHFALRVEDVRAMAVFMRNEGFPPLGDFVARPDGSTSIFCRDPDGNLVEFIQP